MFMKKIKKIVVLLLASLSFVSCGNTPSSISQEFKEHPMDGCRDEEDKCPTCGGCLSTCIHPACSNNRCSCTVTLCEHTYSNWEIILYPSLGTEGEVRSICDKCFEPTTESLPKLGEGDNYTKEVTGVGDENGFGIATYTYYDEETGIRFTKSVSEYPEGAMTLKKECEEMSLIAGEKGGTPKPVNNGGVAGLGYMSGASQKGNGYYWEVSAASDCKALLVICCHCRSNVDINLNATYALTISYNDGVAQDLPVSNDFYFPRVAIDRSATEVEICMVDLKAGKNKMSLINDSGLAGLDWDYWKLITVGEIADYVAA